jgi:hypothetical protein
MLLIQARLGRKNVGCPVGLYMKLCIILRTVLFLGVSFFGVWGARAVTPADVIIVHAQVLTVDANFAIAQAVAVRSNEIVAVGKDAEVEKFKGPDTRVIDARGATVLPGLSDSYVDSYKASLSALMQMPVLASIPEAQDYIRKQAAKLPGTNHWIVVEGVYPSRVIERRLPTKKELDEAAPKNPVYWDCGELVMLNTVALKACNITKDTKYPLEGEVSIDPETLVPTGLLRRASSLVKLNPPKANLDQQRAALKKIYASYNEQGVTSIRERRANQDAIKLFRELSAAGELTVRIHANRFIDPDDKLTEAEKQLDALTNAASGNLGTTGAGDDWVSIGALSVQLDGDLRNGTAYLRTPWGIGPTYQITEPAYRGEIEQEQETLSGFFLKAVERGWQLDVDCTGDAALDQLLNCLQRVNFKKDISAGRFVISHATFQADEDWSRLKKYGVIANTQPATIYCDGGTLLKNLSEHRLRNFLPYKTFASQGVTVAGGSGHEAGLDALTTYNPFSPWLGMWAALARQTTDGAEYVPEQKATREQVIRMYTSAGAYINFAESRSGSLEVGKLADLIMIDRNILKCPVDDVKATKVKLTMVAGRTVWEEKP